MDDAAPRARVLILVENLSVPFDRRVWQEATCLRRAGYDVSVICPKGRGHDLDEEVIDGVLILRHTLPFEAEGALGYLREYASALFGQMRLAIRLWRRKRFDVVQACNPPDLLFLVAAPFKLLFGVRFIFDHHDVAPELFEVKFGRKGVVHAALRLAERLTFRMADASIATNETFRDIAVARGRMDPARVRIVRSYPDLARFRRTAPQTGLVGPEQKLIGYVGIIGEQDGVDLLVRAVAHMRHEMGRRDMRCVIIGNGPAVAGCEALARELGVADDIVFTGYLGGEALLAHLSAIDIGVIPDPSNPFNDKLSMNKVFEYMALGIPFAMYDLAQASREAGDAALVVNARGGPAHAALAAGLAALMDDPERCARMRTVGLERSAREFTWSTQETALLEAYDMALGSIPDAKAVNSL